MKTNVRHHLRRTHKSGVVPVIRHQRGVHQRDKSELDAMKRRMTERQIIDRMRASRPFMSGNVLSDDQFSWIIRPYDETEVNGEKRKAGVLQDYDINMLKDYETSEVIKRLGKHDAVYYYRIRHMPRQHTYDTPFINDGVLLTNGKGKIIYSRGKGKKFNDAIRKIPIAENR